MPNKWSAISPSRVRLVQWSLEVRLMYERGPWSSFDLLVENAFKVSVRIQRLCVVSKASGCLYSVFKPQVWHANSVWNYLLKSKPVKGVESLMLMWQYLEHLIWSFVQWFFFNARVIFIDAVLKNTFSILMPFWISQFKCLFWYFHQVPWPKMRWCSDGSIWELWLMEWTLWMKYRAMYSVHTHRYKHWQHSSMCLLGGQRNRQWTKLLQLKIRNELLEQLGKG